ncbi:MAG TPA: phosphate ABC transporter permease PstA [Thermoanaerobaculia bacterium]|nr:phosphate ABC transporter permease PstA [Thermoanaerobaculia bacterium]
MNHSVIGTTADPAVDATSRSERVARPRAAATSKTASLFGGHRRRSALLGRSLTWLCGGALALNVLLVLAILLLLAYNGLGYFWQRGLVELTLADGRKLLGEVWEEQALPARTGEPSSAIDRLRIKTGNRDIDGLDFAWIDRKDITAQSEPPQAVLLERLEWGNFHGVMQELRAGGRVTATGPEAVWKAFGPLHEKKVQEREEIRELEKGDIGDINYKMEALRLAQRKLDLDTGMAAAERRRRSEEIEQRIAILQVEYEKLADRLTRMREELLAETLVMRTAAGDTKEVPVGSVVRAIRPNGMGALDKLGLYLSRAWEFVSDDPRESNTEGGIFPAIFGTVMMTLIMAVIVTPFGVLAAIYLREYAKQGPLTRVIRIAVNNLAGVPAIVYGVFGLGFFVYVLGGSIDRLFFPEAAPAPTFGTPGLLWASLTLAILAVPVVIVATEEGLARIPRALREGSLALGATKAETLWKVVLPMASPAMMTGLILAVARAAGEVAPLMLVGVVKLAPSLPVDGNYPYLHLDQKIMHLGFHIYDVGFQSPNVEAARPLVYATALLLVLVIAGLNLSAVFIRNHLREKYKALDH